MRCEDLAERLTDFMEGELSADEESAAVEHLATCSSCETVLAETRDAVHLARGYGRVQLSAADRVRMLEAILDDGSASA